MLFFLQLPSWSQRKALQIILKEKASIVSNIEVKMANRNTPTEEELVSGDDGCYLITIRKTNWWFGRCVNLP